MFFQWRKNYKKIAISNDVRKQAVVPPLMNLFTTQQFYVDPLTPKGDLHLNSPYNTTPESHIKVMRIKEVITNLRNS